MFMENVEENDIVYILCGWTRAFNKQKKVSKFTKSNKFKKNCKEINVKRISDCSLTVNLRNPYAICMKLRNKTFRIFGM